jgi:SMI1 / KNR4 family (SUKH-1)
MTEYSDLIQRLKEKLLEAKKADKNLKVFGADRHKYLINKPTTIESVMEFETKYSIKLPGCYKSFILEFGNGGQGWQNSAAGPFFGIYPLGENVNELIYENTEKYLKNECVIIPKMTDDFWKSLTKNIEENDEITNEDYEIELGKVWGGILPIGSQGCTYLHGIVLNGQYKGKVVNLDTDRQKPHFTYETNFLDWYERWLDEIIDKTLLQDGPSWFGYGVEGNSEQLLTKYQNETNTESRSEIANAILQKSTIDTILYDFIEQEYLFDKNNLILLQILTKFDYSKAKKYLLQVSEIDFPLAMKAVSENAIDKGNEWLEIINKNIDKIENHNSYLNIRKILEKTEIDFGEILLPLLSSETENIRSSVINTLGNLKAKNKYLKAFIVGLSDNSKSVVLHSLYALYESKEKILIPHYQKILYSLPVEKSQIEQNIENSIISNLNLFNLTRESLQNTPNILNDKKWYQFWK